MSAVERMAPPEAPAGERIVAEGTGAAIGAAVSAVSAADTRGSPERVHAPLLYGRLLATAVEHTLAGGPPPDARLRLADGRVEPLPLERWVGPVDADDRGVLAGLRGPVLDIGCGPGRHVAALREAGVSSLGVDLSPVAVALARERGGTAVLGSIFSDVPRAGTWRTVVLLDGNIGIGGSPPALLRRVASVLAPGGTALVEVEPWGAGTRRLRVRLEAPGVVSDWFLWARVSADGLAPLAARARLRPSGLLRAGERWFVRLERD